MDDFYRRNCEKNIWWRRFSTWTSFFWKMRIKFISLISVAGRFGQQLISGSLSNSKLKYFGRNLCSDASRTEHQSNRCLLLGIRNKCLLWKFHTSRLYTLWPQVKQETSKNTKKKAKETQDIRKEI
jgi:hypothetical protein